MITCSRNIPLADAIQRSTEVLDVAMLVFLLRCASRNGADNDVGTSHGGAHWKQVTELAFEVRTATIEYIDLKFLYFFFVHYEILSIFLIPLLEKKLKNLDFDGLDFGHYQAVYLVLVSHVDVWEGGPLKDEISAIVQFCSRVSKLLEPGSS